MPTLDSEFLPLAKDLIAELGKSVTFKLETGEYDETTGEIPASSVETYTEKVSPPDNYSSGMVDGDTILRDDTQIILAAKDLTWTPVVGMVVTIDSSDFEVVRIKNVYPGESIAYYEMQLRG